MSAAHDTHEEEVHEGPKVLATRGKVRTVQVVRPNPHETTFLAATAKGLGVRNVVDAEAGLESVFLKLTQNGAGVA